MNEESPPKTVFPVRIASPSGLSIELASHGAIRRMDHQDIMLNLFLGNEVEGGLSNIYLRLTGERNILIPLLGARSPAVFEINERGLLATGNAGGVDFRVRLVLAESAPAWFWHVELRNPGKHGIACELIHTQDVGLAHYGAIRLNEYYVSQYIDHTPISHAKRGWTVASRQNQSMGGRCPWMLTGSLRHAVGYSTDALQFHGLATRANKPPLAASSGLPGKRLQHEHSLVALQDEAMLIPADSTIRAGFFAVFTQDKPTATSPEDVAMVDKILELPEAHAPEFPPEASAAQPAPEPCHSLFARAPVLEALPLDAGEVLRIFGMSQLNKESVDGQLLSFFTKSGSHVVLQRKEELVLRPHGHLMRTGGALVPDESALTSTAWMNGVFHSMVTQGHVSINRFLSTCHTYLGLFRSHGQRIFIQIEGEWKLLDKPSAFEIALDRCRWIYRHKGGLIEVVSQAPDTTHQLTVTVNVLEGPTAALLFSHHVALNGDDGSQSIPARWSRTGDALFLKAVPDSDVGRRFPDGGFIIRPASGTGIENIGDDALLYADGISRNQPFLCISTTPAESAGLVIEGSLLQCDVPMQEDFWKSMGAGLCIEAPATSPLAEAAGRAARIFPWFIHNALVHYLSPRGLEQYSGGGWGTRDVCQGPVEMLFALGRMEPIRDLLCRVFRQQNADGDWPQWFMFFDRERNIRPGDSHGDIVYWPILALAQYLSATGDNGLLEEQLPYFHPDGEAAAEKQGVWQHVERALALMKRRTIEGTRLAAYGHGDWNDSLQPAQPGMRDHLCSSWTVTLNYQTVCTLATALRTSGDESKAGELETLAEQILREFQDVLVVDGVIAGLAYFHTERRDGKPEYLLHPNDKSTGLSYSLLPMIHAIINGMLTPKQAAHHLELIHEHLSGPDGAHLFDRPIVYRGGPQTHFQRAESASFFGREIGIMYTHAHLRYCEALAHYGDANAFFHALSQMNPIGMRESVATATLRQSNCYYSSSDPVFADRYEASADYNKVKRGLVALEGGWRVYSSGAGIGARLIVQCFLGLRRESTQLIIDPVVPRDLDGLKASLDLNGLNLSITYKVGERGCGVCSLRLDGKELEFERDANPYRPGAVRVSLASFNIARPAQAHELVVSLG